MLTWPRILQRVPLTAFYFSPYLPDARSRPFAASPPAANPIPACCLRPGRPRIDLASSFAIGDKRSDMAAGRAAGCRTILLRTGCAGTAACPEGEPDWIADDLLHAARIVKTAQVEASTPVRNGAPDDHQSNAGALSFFGGRHRLSSPLQAAWRRHALCHDRNFPRPSRCIALRASRIAASAPTIRSSKRPAISMKSSTPRSAANAFGFWISARELRFIT